LTVLNSPRHEECRDTKISKIEATTIFCSFSVSVSDWFQIGFRILLSSSNILFRLSSEAYGAAKIQKIEPIESLKNLENLKNTFEVSFLGLLEMDDLRILGKCLKL
jgi:hypothetical protein